jgi:hypothetical protein
MKLESAGGLRDVQSTTCVPGTPANQTNVQDSLVQITSTEPAAIYHGAENPASESLLNKTGVRLYAQMLYTQEEWDESMKIPPGVLTGVGQPSADLRRAYDDALSRLTPELRAKDWGFSVSEGKLVLTTGADSLSDQEIATIRLAFQDAGVEDAANAVANFVVKAIEEDRYWMYRYLGKGIGRFDVSISNFGEIVNLRSFMEDLREGGRYDPHLVDPTNYSVGYESGKFALMEQIEARAKQIEVPVRMVFV